MDLSDAELRAELKKLGHVHVVTPSTRSVLVKKLEKLRGSSKKAPVSSSVTVPAAKPGLRGGSFSSDEQSGNESSSSKRRSKRLSTSTVDSQPVVNGQDKGVIPGRANIGSDPSPPRGVGRPKNVSPTKRATPTARVLPAQPPKPSPSSGHSDSFSFSDSDAAADESGEDSTNSPISLVNRSINTSFAPPSTQTSTRRRSAGSSTANGGYGSISPVSSMSPSSKPLSATRRSLYDDVPTWQRGRNGVASSSQFSYSKFTPSVGRPTTNGTRPTQLPPSSWSNRASSTLAGLNAFRRNTYEAFKGRFCRQPAGAIHRAYGAGDDDEDEYIPRTKQPQQRWSIWRTMPEKQPSRSFGSRFSDEEEASTERRTSRWSLTEHKVKYGLCVFLLSIVLCYLGTVHWDKIVVASHITAAAAVDTVSFIYQRMILPVAAIVLVCGMVAAAFFWQRHRWHAQAEEQRQVYEMVERIICILQKHHEERVASGDADSFLAIPHVRDILIPASKRKEMLPIWEKAVLHLKENESRVREENQFISGEEFMVWRWLQTTIPSVGETRKGATEGDEAQTPGRGWQGLAFPEEDIGRNMPAYAYTQCLKARGLFDPSTEKGPDWPEEVQRSVLEKIGDNAIVVHLSVDRYSKDGCVYLKCSSRVDAGNAYKALHGSWFNGRLVSVKYVRPERYHERFPDSQFATAPLRARRW